MIDAVIPRELANLKNLVTLNLSSNNISGSIPPEIGRLVLLETLDLSRNRLTAWYAQTYQLVIHSLSGYVPKEIYCSFPHNILQGNKEQLGLQKDLSCSNHSTTPSLADKPKRYLRIILPLTIFLGFLFIGALIFTRYLHKKKKPETIVQRNGDIFSVWNYDGKIAFEDIIEVTEDFDIKYCIGTGAYGSVYKASLPSGRIVALKKLHRTEAQDPSFSKSFHNEVKMLTEIRHRNIIKLHGFCLHNRCMFLIYEYMERGSLFYVLRNDAEAEELNWSKRVNAIKGIANALSYMHDYFGTARILDPDSSNQTLLVGTYGYVAPGNKKLLGLEKDLSCSNHSTTPSPAEKLKRYLRIILPLTIFLDFLLIGALIFTRYLHKKKTPETIVQRNGDIFSVWNYDGKIAFEDIIGVTEDFDIKYCIGIWLYGSVYKASLPSGRIVALKKLHRTESQDPIFQELPQ
ncbi:MDIS1-interacting receptor like kinase 2-like [Senna tora]|uniref:non-specific serine/threonine protein kinase n=1 Tax=Senna tora TaxID=362788 RepID=A0A834XGF1_9FABA|nr:MDIS1-interacting receptor like kinase 2-like [Senna tora]